MMDNGFSRAEAQYENRMPTEPTHIGNIYVGYPVKILTGIFDGKEGMNGRNGIVERIDGNVVAVRCGARLLYFFPDELEAVE